MKKQKIPRLWNIPLFDYNWKSNPSDKDLKKIGNEEISIVGYIGFICMLSLFIYYWIVDYGKPGFMDQVIDIENPSRADKLIIQWQNNLYFLPDSMVNFFADLFLYGCISLFFGSIVIIVLNFILRRIF